VDGTKLLGKSQDVGRGEMGASGRRAAGYVAWRGSELQGLLGLATNSRDSLTIGPVAPLGG